MHCDVIGNTHHLPIGTSNRQGLVQSVLFPTISKIFARHFAKRSFHVKSVKKASDLFYFAQISHTRYPWQVNLTCQLSARFDL